MNEFYAILTDEGKNEVLNCVSSSQIFKAYYAAVGDGNGTYYEPETTQTALKNETYRGNVYKQGKRENYLFFDMQLPPSVGDFIIREVGVFSENGSLLCVAKYPETLKKSADSSSEKVLNIEIQVELSDKIINLLTIDDSGILVTEEKLAESQIILEEGIENNDARITLLENSARTAIGDPVITLANSLEENEIWLEGAEVSKTTYALLYEIYGDTYGTAESEDNFILPDFRDRAIWGASDFGYLEAGLPNITGMATIGGAQLFYGTSGALYSAGTISAANTGHSAQTTTAVKLGFNATKSSSIYGASTTVQPPSIKVRVKTRYA